MLLASFCSMIAQEILLKPSLKTALSILLRKGIQHFGFNIAESCLFLHSLLYLNAVIEIYQYENTYFFKAANRFVSSSTSGIIPPTGPLLSIPFLGATSDNVCIFLVGFRSSVPLTLG